MSDEEKSVFGHITDWFKELGSLGIAGLLIGLGFVLVFIEGIMFTNNAQVSFYYVVSIGFVMILLGTYVKIVEVKAKKQK